jgi:hypothetical protein
VPNTQTVTILFTDIVGSTAVASRLGPQDADQVRQGREFTEALEMSEKIGAPYCIASKCREWAKKFHLAEGSKQPAAFPMLAIASQLAEHYGFEGPKGRAAPLQALSM